MLIQYSCNGKIYSAYSRAKQQVSSLQYSTNLMSLCILDSLYLAVLLYIQQPIRAAVRQWATF